MPLVPPLNHEIKPSHQAQGRWCSRQPWRALLLAAVAGQLSVVLAGCGAGARSTGAAMQGERSALVSYLRQVEPVRLAVNRLLAEADPILMAYSRRRIHPDLAALRMGGLERRFAAYAIDIAAISPATHRLSALHAIYAHTYILEDSYLSALVSGLAQGNVERLPNTQAAQRAAIIEWRTGLAVLARQLGLELPGDLQAAGRGEIAPSPRGS
jgi:hypothetical protein